MKKWFTRFLFLVLAVNFHINIYSNILSIDSKLFIYNEDCKLSELQLEKSACNADKQFFVSLNFQHENTSDCFTVKGNGADYGTFLYADLPITIGPLAGNCETPYEFVIRDCEKEDCAIEKSLGKVCCENPNADCKLAEMELKKSDCFGEKYFSVTLNFFHKNTSDCFTVKGNGKLYGTYKYADLPIKIDSLIGNCDSNFFFVVRDCHNERCVIEKELGKVCCENPNPDCKLSELQLDKSACDGHKMFFVTINFKHENTSDCFVVKGNGINYGTFKYTDLPIKIVPLNGNCETEYEFDIRDCHNERCGLEKVLGKVCCENPNTDCKLAELQLQKSDCVEEKKFYVTLNFLYKNTSDCFTVSGNGRNYGTFKYSDLPIKLGPLEGNCETNYGFVVRDCHNERCAIEKSLGKVCCETQNNDCQINELELKKSECTPEKKFFVTLNFGHKNTSDCFTVSGNGHNYGTFKYTDLPLKLGPLNGNCETEYEFVIRDCHNERCGISKVLGKVCCETQNNDCQINELELKKSECTPEKKFFVTLNFGHKNTSDCFTVSGNGHNYGTFKYTDLPLKLGPLNGNCETEYEFVIRDCHNERCGISKVLGKVCCETQNNDCQINELELKKSECTPEKKFFVTLNFGHKNTSDCFTVSGNGHNYGTFKYADLPIKIGPLDGNCETNYGFVVRDCHNEKCAVDKSLGKVCCESQNNDCKLSELDLKRTECNAEKKFYVTINFGYKNVSDCFTVSGNGHNYGTFKYTDLPIKIGPLDGNCETNYGFVIRDCHNERCALEKNLGKVCCESQSNCKIYEVDAIPQECTGKGSYSLKLNFLHSGTGSRFNLYDRNGKISDHAYSDLPLTLPHFAKSAVKHDFMKICDQENPSCCKAVEFIGLECLGAGKSGFKVNRLKAFFDGSHVQIQSEQLIPDQLAVSLYDLSGSKLSFVLNQKSALSWQMESGIEQSGIYILRVQLGQEFYHYRIFVSK
ncbi:MAG: hypothetical protein IPM48_10365 [Saprospiraceae bacterium]|nr:hypothetical protein [Saprospiraceae bacterium]